MADGGCWCFAHRTCGPGALPTPAIPSPLGPWVTKFLGEPAAASMCVAPVCNSGLFMTSASNVRDRPAQDYAAIRNALSVSASPEAGYFMERVVALAYALPTLISGDMDVCKPVLGVDDNSNESLCSLVRWNWSGAH